MTIKTAATIGFIAVVGVAGLFVGTRSTVIDGRVLAADLLPQFKKQHPTIQSLECDREIPVDPRGALFRCTITEAGGAQHHVQYRMRRDGTLTSKSLGATPARKP